MEKNLIYLLVFILFSCKISEPSKKKWDYGSYSFADSTMSNLWCSSYKCLQEVQVIDSIEIIHIASRSCFLPHKLIQVKKLKYMSIESRKIRVDKNIKGFPSLKTLWILSAPISKPTQCWFIESPQLELLVVDFVESIKVLDKIAQMRQLKRLQVGIRFFDSLPKSMENLENLERLDASHYDSLKVMKFPKFISKLTKLRRLYLTVDLSDNLQYLNGLDNLDYLRVYSFEKFDTQYHQLKNLKNLKRIAFEKELTQEQLQKLKILLPQVNIGAIYHDN